MDFFFFFFNDPPQPAPQIKWQFLDPPQPAGYETTRASLLDSSLVLPIVERLESDWLSVWTGVFYTGNEFKHVQLIQVMSGG